MKTKLITLLMIISLVVTVTAGISISIINKEIQVEEATFNQLRDEGIDDFDYADEQQGNLTRRIITKEICKIVYEGAGFFPDGTPMDEASKPRVCETIRGESTWYNSTEFLDIGVWQQEEIVRIADRFGEAEPEEETVIVNTGRIDIKVGIREVVR